jgi:AAA domain
VTTDPMPGAARAFTEIDRMWAAYNAQLAQQPTQPNGYQLAVPAAPGRRAQGISMLFHGHPKRGKSTLADSGPRPTLILDVEGTSYWTLSRKIYWDPQRETVPTWPQDARAVSPDGYWDSCVVIVRDYKDAHQVKKVLDSGAHPFNSIDIDGVSEFQQRVMDSVAGTSKMSWDDWGVLLRQVQGLVRGYRDLIHHPTRPVWAITMTAGTHWDNKRGMWRPLLQGASSDYVPYYPDLVGWLDVAPDGSRHLLAGPHPQYETGSRFGERLPYSLQLAYPGYPGWAVTDILTQVLSTQETR